MARLRKLGKAGNYFAYFYDASHSPKEKSVALKTTHKSTAMRRKVDLERRYEKGDFDPWQPEEVGVEPLSLQEATEQFLQANNTCGLNPSRPIASLQTDF